MGEADVSKLWADRWRLASILVPVLLMALLAHQAVLPLATRLRDTNAQLSTLRQNKYEASWLDSTKSSLQGEVALLRDFQISRESGLGKNGSVQSTIDQIRRLAQANGFEVVKTMPIVSRREPLSQLKLKMEGFVRYPGLLAFCDTLNAHHPDLFLEEMLIRQGGDRSEGRLESQLIFRIYTRNRGDSP